MWIYGLTFSKEIYVNPGGLTRVALSRRLSSSELFPRRGVKIPGYSPVEEKGGTGEGPEFHLPPLGG